MPVELDVLRDRNALYHEPSGGVVRNVYTLKIVNMHDEPLRWRIGASGIEGLSLEAEHGDRAMVRQHRTRPGWTSTSPAPRARAPTSGFP